MKAFGVLTMVCALALKEADVRRVFGKALTNGLNPLSGIWAREELISPTAFGPIAMPKSCRAWITC